MWPFVSRRVHEAVLADRERIRGERDQFKDDRDAAQAAAKTGAAQFAHADEELAATSIVNVCLTEELSAVKKQLAEARAQLTDSAAAHWSAQARREKKRADRLQKQYDDAVGLKPGGIEDSRPWQPGYKADAS